MSPPTLLCLHGWGGTKDSFRELRSALSGSDLRILTPDLPGFGDEPEPKSPWSVDDYADWIVQWIQTQNVEGPLNLLGHSHGGRISILLASRNLLPIQHLYLCAAAGIRHPRHFRRIIGLSLAKSGKTFLSLFKLPRLESFGQKMLYKLVRVHDYERASPVMRKTLQRVSAQDLRSLLPNIRIPTDIFWGTDDGMTPVKDGKLMHRLIPGSTLHLFTNARHGIHRDHAKEIAEVIRKNLSLSSSRP